MLPIIFIVGLTATGKTDLSYLLAQELNAEIISCDSMLVYREPCVITSKPSARMTDSVKHHFIDIISVEDQYSVFEYYREAIKSVTDLHKEGKPIIICGGSGLYMKALCDGLFVGPGKDESLRKELKERAKELGTESLHQELGKIDPTAHNKISSNDLRRIIRALEVYHLSGVPMSQIKEHGKGLWGQYPIKIFCLSSQKPYLHERINLRAERMFASGAIEEVKGLLKMKLSPTAEKIIGIKEIEEFLDGKIDRLGALEKVKVNTRKYAKRQLTWFKADARFEWLSTDGESMHKTKEKILARLSI